MGSVKVTVFGRIKPCLKSPLDYKIKSTDEEDQITYITPKVPAKRSFRFKKIFGEDATQEQIFETVAKPVIKNLFSGYNGTIFTYGQTGSGKTYTMTGDIEEWANPGLIPRVIQELFKEKSVETLITISFCEIYNEHIYDLVRNDLPENETATVSILTESSSGITNFRNLSNHRVKTADEAMQLFLRGDSNKMVAETGSNFRSSRSHAIFSIALEFQHPTQENLRMKPVLYLVDLAGSERLSKCKTPLSNASETRYINLSLHYLEQVLLALRQPGRAHIPYRNSLMTALLKNSLGGNSITIMIATLSVFREDAEETTQTCRFAERVALIKNEVKLIELSNPEKEIDYLKKENERLKAQLKLLCKEQVVEQLDEKEKERCLETVRNFIQENDIFDLPLTNVRRMEYCFKIMRDEILKEKEFNDGKDMKIKDSQLEPRKKNNNPSRRKVMFLKDSDYEKPLMCDTKWKDLGSKQKSPFNNEVSRARELFKTIRTIKSVKSIKSLKSIKSVKSFNSIKNIKAIRPFGSDESKLMEKNSRTSVNKAFERVNSVEIPKVNIVYGEPSQDKENDIPMSRDMKVKFSTSMHEKDEKLNPKVSNHATQIFFQKKACDAEPNWAEKERNFENKVMSCTSTSTLEYTPKKDESKNLVGSSAPPRRIISSLFNETCDEKNSEGSVREKSQVKKEKSLEKGTKSPQEKISTVPSSNDFMAFTSKCVPLTGDKEVDEEIIKFYKTRYQLFKNK